MRGVQAQQVRVCVGGSNFTVLGGCGLQAAGAGGHWLGQWWGASRTASRTFLMLQPHPDQLQPLSPPLQCPPTPLVGCVANVSVYNVYDSAVPFGGYRSSGVGRDKGEYALEAYTQASLFDDCLKAPCAL